MYIELNQVSRGYQVTTDNIRQTFVYVICDEDLDSDDNTFGAFFTPNDDVGVALFVYATFPIYRTFPANGFNLLLLLTEHSAEDIGNGNWRVTLVYSISASESNPSYIQFGVEIGGTTVHLLRSLEVTSAVSRTGLNLTPPNNYRILGLTRNSIEGADVLSRGLKFNITGYYSAQVWSPAVLLTWSALQTTYNNAVFYGFAPGQVQLQSISAQGEVFKKVPVTFNFEALPNLNGVNDAPFPPIFALGHDQVDYLFGEEISENYPIKGPLYRYIHRVYEPGNCALLGV